MIGVLHSLIRLDEKMIFSEFEKRNVEFERIDERNLLLNPEEKPFEYDLVLDRSMSYFNSLMTLAVLNSFGIRAINSYETVSMCGNKMLTSLALARNKVPMPKTLLAGNESKAIEAANELKYPCVMKPLIGSWGRMVSKINDRDAVESIVEHKNVLGNFMHSVHYFQEFIEKNGRDIRAFVVGNEVVAAIYRESDHWITNTARGGKVSNCKVYPELEELALKASNACGSGVLAIDLFELGDELLVNEVNHSMEFKNSVSVTGVNIPGKIVDYAVEEARR